MNLNGLEVPMIGSLILRMIKSTFYYGVVLVFEIIVSFVVSKEKRSFDQA